MKWAFELLELPTDADVTSVKRAYARLLRITRPDDNPEGFQRLHSAYKLALAHADKQSKPVSHSSADGPTTTKPAPSDVAPAAAINPTLSAPSQPAAAAAPIIQVNLGTLANEIIRVATEAENGNALFRWLEARPEFWSIQVKQQTGQLTLNRLFQNPQAMSSECLNAILRFFDLDHVLSGINALALQQLRVRQSTQWELIPNNHHALAQRVGLLRNGRPNVIWVRKYLSLLQQPLGWRPIMWTAFRQGRVHNVGRFVQALLGGGRFEELPPSIDRHHALFWYRAAASGPITWPRFAIGALRATVAALLCALFLVAVIWLSSSTANQTGGDVWRNAVVIIGTASGSIIGLWLLYVGCLWFDYWQGLPESFPSRRPWLRRAAIPMLCAFGLLFYYADAPYFASPMVFISFIFAVRRFRHRTPKQPKKAPLRIGSMTPAIAFICIAAVNALSHMQGDLDFPIVPVAAAATFCTWFADMWRHRTQLWPKLARR